MGISSLGIGSGLDLKTLLAGIKEGQEARLAPIAKQQKNLDAKVSSYGLLKNSLSQFDTATKDLQKADTFNSRKLINTNDSFIASAKSGAALGDYSIKIDQIASSHSVASDIISNDTPIINDEPSRTITIEQKNGKQLTVTVDAGKKSLKDIANAINEATLTNEDGMTSPSTMNATVVKSSSDGYQLIISSKESGIAQSITSITSSDNILDKIIAFNANDEANSSMQEAVAGKDAKFNLNGIAITSQSNTISNVINGVDLTLKGTTSSTELMSIEANNDDLKNTIKGWVTAFNQLKSTIAYVTRFSPEEAKKASENNNGALLGDSVVREVDRTISSILSQGQSGKFSVLSDIGVTMEPATGQLKLNENKLQEVLSKDSDAVAELFIGDGKTTGLANQISSAANKFIENNGRISNVEKGLASSKKNLEKRHDQIEDAIEQSIDRYRSKFNKLDVMSSKLGATTNYLRSQLGASK